MSNSSSAGTASASPLQVLDRSRPMILVFNNDGGGGDNDLDNDDDDDEDDDGVL